MPNKPEVTILQTEEDITAFLEEHRGEIRGLYTDKWCRNGGNGKIDAIGECEKRYGVKIDTADLSDDRADELFQNVFK